MFAICSVKGFNPERVKNGENPCKINNPVNLDNVTTFWIERQYILGTEKKYFPCITFEFINSTTATWYFHSDEERDQEYQGLANDLLSIAIRQLNGG